MADWIDEEIERRQLGLTRNLSQSDHIAVNQRRPGSTLEHCLACGDPTGRAGRGDDSIYCDQCECGPFCEKCIDAHIC